MTDRDSRDGRGRGLRRDDRSVVAVLSSLRPRIVLVSRKDSAGATVTERERGADSPADQDLGYMRRALELARNGLGLAEPNPMVGAVLVNAGDVVGEGWHEGPGTAHAEVNALRAAGERARGGTLYVTLEPCSHQGRTPPCAPAVAEAGVARVLAAVRDPNPAVDGRGLQVLRAAGIDVTEGILMEEGHELIAGFAKHVRTGLPLVTVKMAASLDGRVAAPDGSSRWITGDQAREDVHRLRASSGAIVVGAGTAAADDPSLTVRLQGYRGRPPVRVLLDATGRTPSTGSLFQGAAPTLVATTQRCPAEARTAWEKAGAEVLVFETEDPRAGVPWRPLLEALGKRDVTGVLVEGGPTIAGTAIDACVADRLVLYLAPKLIGGPEAPGILGGRGIETIADARSVRIESVMRIGDDVKIVASLRGSGNGVYGDR